jgi:hypothetical protein
MNRPTASTRSQTQYPSPTRYPLGTAGVGTESSSVIESGLVVSVTQAGSAAECEVEDLVVRIAGRDDRDAIAELAGQAGSPRPDGALMVAEAADRLLAAVSIASGQVVREPTRSGAAAAAVVRYTLATWERRGRVPRRRLAASVG